MKTCVLLAAVLIGLSLAGCSKTQDTSAKAADAAKSNEQAKEQSLSGADTGAETEESAATAKAGAETELQVFIAASLNNAMQEIAEQYQAAHPGVKILLNADSSGKLMTQIEEGYACDVFFSAAEKQMDQLEQGGFLVDGTRRNVLNNQVCVISRKDSGTKVTGLENIAEAGSIALADGSVPVGKYTREAMVRSGLLEKVDDVSRIMTSEISEQLGGVEISEQSNVSKVLTTVVEGSCEVGTTYYSDTYGYEDQLAILEKVPYELSGNVLYPVAAIHNDEANASEADAAQDFIGYITSDAGKAIFEKYYFDTNVQG